MLRHAGGCGAQASFSNINKQINKHTKYWTHSSYSDERWNSTGFFNISTSINLIIMIWNHMQQCKRSQSSVKFGTHVFIVKFLHHITSANVLTYSIIRGLRWLKAVLFALILNLCSAYSNDTSKKKEMWAMWEEFIFLCCDPFAWFDVFTSVSA